MFACLLFIIHVLFNVDNTGRVVVRTLYVRKRSMYSTPALILLFYRFREPGNMRWFKGFDNSNVYHILIHSVTVKNPGVRVSWNLQMMKLLH